MGQSGRDPDLGGKDVFNVESVGFEGLEENLGEDAQQVVEMQT